MIAPNRRTDGISDVIAPRTDLPDMGPVLERDEMREPIPAVELVLVCLAFWFIVLPWLGHVLGDLAAGWGR